MIDPHAHLRDWDQADKETVRHGLSVARAAGLDAVFEMPNTSPALTTLETIERRLGMANGVSRDLGLTHGLYAGLTSDPDQIRVAAGAHARLYPRVVGLKLYAGHSTGRMGVVGPDEQRVVYRTLARLGWRGVLAVHAEKEELVGSWDPARPSSHATARPAAAELESVRDQIRLAGEEGFRGVLHLAHVSVPETLDLAREARAASPPFRITTGVTPHHVLLCAEDMDRPGGALLKVNPPLRPRPTAQRLLDALVYGRVDWVETDHAPHTLRDKTEGHASGIPVFPYYPRFLRYLKTHGVSAVALDGLTHGNIERAFGFAVPRRPSDLPEPSSAEYPFDPFASLAPSGPPTVSLIVALDELGLIGARGGMPWRHPEDMRYFRATTMGRTLILGRKTFQGLWAPLRGRRVIVLTRTAGFVAPEGVLTARTPGEALSMAEGPEVFVGGGAEVYAQYLARADRIYATRMAGAHEGDTFFPTVDWGDWRKVWEKPGEGCRFERWERRESRS